jgi:Xaa-Pro aminopeptidase
MWRRHKRALASFLPIDTRCIDLSLMRDEELTWLNQYHATVLERLAPRVSGDALRWLQARTVPIQRG